jgi:hypothetical protein
MRADIAAVDENRNDFTDGLRKIDVCRVGILPCKAFSLATGGFVFEKYWIPAFAGMTKLPE